jgi:hypothetical protein
MKQLTTPKPQQHIEPPSSDLIERVLLDGDLSRLTTEQRLNYYKSVCDTLGLNPLTKPFDYITLDNKLVLYARKDCTEQLRKRYGISLEIKSREKMDDVYSVIAQATLPTGRKDESIGAVPLRIIKDGQTHALSAIGQANAIMKAETKAKRRVTLSICGLGIMDETELDTVNYEFDQRTDSEIMERNIKEATANATGEKPLEPVTEDNYSDVICHVGKAQGNILGRRVGDIHPKIIEWLVKNWVPKLAAVPDEKDARLRDAVMFALKKGNKTPETAPSTAQAASEAPKPIPDGPPQTKARTGALNSVELANQLIEKAKDLMLTPDQFSGYLKLWEFMPEYGTLADHDPEELNWLLTVGWQRFADWFATQVKPKVIEKTVKKRGKKKEKGPFE